MAYDWSSILTAQAERIDQELAECAAQLETARQREDADHVMWNANRILELDAQRSALGARADYFVRQQAAAPRQHPSGLSDLELEVARNSTAAAPRPNGSRATGSRSRSWRGCARPEPMTIRKAKCSSGDPWS